MKELQYDLSNILSTASLGIITCQLRSTAITKLTPKKCMKITRDRVFWIPNLRKIKCLYQIMRYISVIIYYILELTNSVFHLIQVWSLVLIVCFQDKSIIPRSWVYWWRSSWLWIQKDDWYVNGRNWAWKLWSSWKGFGMYSHLLHLLVHFLNPWNKHCSLQTAYHCKYSSFCPSVNNYKVKMKV